MITKKLIILGSGPAGITAGIYAKRAGLNPLIISKDKEGGALLKIKEIENYPGFPKKISGKVLANNMVKQAKNLGVEFKNDTLLEFLKEDNYFLLKCKNNTYKTSLLIIATGIQKESKIKNQDEFLGFGVSTCTTCDAFFFKEKQVAVFGDDKKELIKDAIFLSDFAKKVFLITKDKISAKEIFATKKIKILNKTSVLEVVGDKKQGGVSSIIIKKEKKEKESLIVDGLFLNFKENKSTKDIFKDYLNFSEDGFLITKQNSFLTNIDGIFAAGDIVKGNFKQVVCACASGALAATEAKNFDIKNR